MSKTETRLYCVTDTESGKRRLIEAPNAAQAIRYVAKRFTCEVAGSKTVALLMGNGTAVERANADTEAQEAATRG